MIPIRDINPSRNYPFVNNALIALNVIVFLFQLSQGTHQDRFVYIYGLVPARYTIDDISSYFSLGNQVFSFVSFMFLHGGFLHLIGNMWSLYIFGDNIEDRLGPFRYLAFYLLCGLLSGISHMLTNWHSNVPVIGASGAISGVMGAYMILYPRAKVLTLIPIIIIPYFVEIPAFFFLGVWFLLQLINAAASMGSATGIAWWAHIGGFVFGIILLKIFGQMPTIGFTDRTRPLITRKTSPPLQIIRTSGTMESPNLYGTLSVTPYEAMNGTTKLVNVPWGFHNRMLKIVVPQNTQDGNILRLKGLGKTTTGGNGDLLFTVSISESVVPE